MKTESTLMVNRTNGWRMGLSNLLGRENAKWWKSSRWWVQTLVWGLIINGILVMLLFLIPFITETFSGVNPDDLADIPDGITVFFSMAGLALPIGVVIILQGSIISERELGTAEWILSKPVSRTAFFLSKLIAHSIGIFVTMNLIQTVLGFGFISVSQGELASLSGFVKGLGGISLLLFFYITLTLMLDVIFDKRGVVLGVALGAALGGALLINLFPGLALVTPFAFPNLIPLIVQGIEIPNFTLWLPFVSTLVMSLVFVFVAIKQFKRKAL